MVLCTVTELDSGLCTVTELDSVLCTVTKLDSGLCTVTGLESYKKIVSNFWNTETVPDEWNIGRLIVLPKKGDLSLPKNYRGIMLLEITYKIIANILHSRLLPIEEQLDHEQQCGFRPNRGCIDAIFTIKSAIKKRSEHGLESWVLFLDLVKAFDRVPRKTVMGYSIEVWSST